MTLNLLLKDFCRVRFTHHDSDIRNKITLLSTYTVVRSAHPTRLLQTLILFTNFNILVWRYVVQQGAKAALLKHSLHNLLLCSRFQIRKHCSGDDRQDFKPGTFYLSPIL
jgi:hypothetical protein